jgi:hypothetical protein
LTSELAGTIVYTVELVYGAGRLDRCVPGDGAPVPPAMNTRIVAFQ